MHVVANLQVLTQSSSPEVCVVLCPGRASTRSTSPKRCIKSSCYKLARPRLSDRRSGSSSSDHTEVRLPTIILVSIHLLMLTPHRSRPGRISAPLVCREHDLLLQLRDDEETYQRPRRRPRRLKKYGFDADVRAQHISLLRSKRRPGIPCSTTKPQRDLKRAGTC